MVSKTGQIEFKDGADKSLRYELLGDAYEWHKGVWVGSGGGNLTQGLMSGYVVSGDAAPIPAGRRRWVLGVPVMHGNPALRERFYHVRQDCDGFIVDVQINDFMSVLEEFGYKVDIWMPEGV